MSAAGKIALGVAGGYVLGRRRKFKLAVALGSMLAGKRIATDPRGLLRQTETLIETNEELAKLSEQVRSQLFAAARSAAVAAASSRMNGLSDAIHARTERLRLAPTGEQQETEDTEDTSDTPDTEDTEGTSTEDTEETTDTGQGSGEEPGSDESGAAKKAAPKKKAAPAKRTGAKSTGAKRTVAKKTGGKKTAAAAKSAGRSTTSSTSSRTSKGA